MNICGDALLRDIYALGNHFSGSEAFAAADRLSKLLALVKNHYIKAFLGKDAGNCCTCGACANNNYIMIIIHGNQSSFCSCFAPSLGINLIAFAGQALAHAPQEMHFSGWKTILRPSNSIAPVGHTDAHPMH